MNEILINLSFRMTKPTGHTTYVNNLFPHLQSLNPTLLTSTPISGYNCYPVPANLTPDQGTKGHFQRLLWTQFQLSQIYEKLKSRLLFSPVPEAPLLSGCRYIVTIHDLIPLRFPKRFSPMTPYFRSYIPAVMTQAQHIICNSTATAKDVCDFYHIPVSKITAIPLAHDRYHFRVLNPPPQDTPPYFLYIGRQDPYKNLQRVIDAFAALPNCRDYQLWLAGPNDSRYTPILQQQAEQLGIAAQVKFLNYVAYNELPTLINGAIALVFPSLWEGFGFPVLEAMACGTPVITSNISSLPEVAGDAAILVNPYDTGEITAAMQILGTDAQARSRLSHQGIIRAQQFSWDKTGQATMEVLKNYL
jgi:glycosyltransferase involved in cell wall biosynthesis